MQEVIPLTLTAGVLTLRDLTGELMVRMNRRRWKKSLLIEYEETLSFFIKFIIQIELNFENFVVSRLAGMFYLTKFTENIEIIVLMALILSLLPVL